MEDAAARFLLDQAKGLIKAYADLISGAGEEFDGLKDDVQRLKATLNDMEKNSSDENGVRLTFQNQIREVVYEVEDTVDSWLTQAADLKNSAKIKRCFIWLSPNHVSLANKVKSLRQGKVKKLLDEAMKMRPSTSKEMRTVRSIRQDKVVRLVDAEENIIRYLTTKQTKLDIIPLIGMPGLGKTTTAWKIFNHKHILSAFPTRIWVHLSERFSTRDVLLQIMKNVSRKNDDLSSKSNQELSNIVHEWLSKEKFLLVMDDVWNIQDWNEIKNALPYGNENSKVLITSCDKAVGRHVQNITEPYVMRFLRPEESWELLQLEVFGNLESCPEDLQAIGRQIAEECEGVPLTVVMTGGILKDSFLSLESSVMVNKKWEEIARNNEHLKSLSGEWVKMIKEAVAISYHGLPDHLRECFLYLGVFPAGYEIPTRTLMSLWISEGFIQPDDNKSLEEIAEDNLKHLISKNLLVVHKINPMLEVKVCRVQNIIRVFCTDEAVKHNFFKEVRMPEEGGALQVQEMDKIHRLCLHSGFEKFFSANLKGQRVRSFLCFPKDVVDLESKYNSVIPEYYLSLRVWHTKSVKFSEFPQNVTKLRLLRYIVLCIADLKKLPQSLSQLLNLQTIIVDTNSDSLTMEANIWKMIHLRHVRTKASIVLDKDWKGKAGENLQTLNRLSPESVTTAISQKASNLKTLGIRGNLGPLLKNITLQKLNHLEKLKLYHAAASERLHCFPVSNRLPPNLKRLTLSKTFLNWIHMSVLANIRNLEVLKLKENAFTGISWEAQNYTFSKLQVLHILNSDLVIWKASESTFPCLRHLELKNCEKLNEIPVAILGSRKLESLDIGRVRKTIAYSANNIALQLKLSADLIDIAQN